MHKLETENLKFQYETNFSGDIVITVPESAVEDGLSGYKLVTVKLSELKSFALHYLRQRTIQNWQEMSEEELESYFTNGLSYDDGPTDDDLLELQKEVYMNTPTQNDVYQAQVEGRIVRKHC